MAASSRAGKNRLLSQGAEPQVVRETERALPGVKVNVYDVASTQRGNIDVLTWIPIGISLGVLSSLLFRRVLTSLITGSL